ncbi:hypothetical protein [Halorussus salinus]|uniref:hypothetical protein n=1 Tax=Halorussus salinus TaxID=1364935 RepID=UPI00109219C9|nr:hypothetical protein [Halorussus salinus]
MASDSYDRLGDASVSANTREVPVPQKAVNLELVKQGGEVYWGVREKDGAVVASQLYDPIQNDPGVRFLTSTVIDDDSRQLPVPDAVSDHWNEEAGGVSVSGGDRLEFVTSDELAADEQLLVLPDWQVEAVLGDE